MQLNLFSGMSVVTVFCAAALSSGTLDGVGDGGHPWASFASGARVDVHTHITLTTEGEDEAREWSSDSRMTLGDVSARSIVLQYECAEPKLAAEITIPVPATASLPGVRSPGRWPFRVVPPDASDEDPEVVIVEWPSIIRGMETDNIREEEVDVKGRSYGARVISRTWNADGQEYELIGWVAPEFEVPVKWTLSVDGELQLESEVVDFDESVTVGDHSVECIVTVTSEVLAEGVIVHRRWGSSEVPGFLVKVESLMETDEFVLEVEQKVTDFDGEALADSEEDHQGNPPGSTPALGITPDYAANVYGVRVAGVREGGPAQDAGIKEADVIVGIDGSDVGDLREYMTVLSGLLIGEEVEVTIERGSKTIDLTVVVGERT